MSKTSIPSPARSHGAITPRRVRPPPKRTRSVASPSLKRTPRLTNILEDAFQLSPLPQRQSILNDDTDIQEPLRKSWWKNLNENSRDMQELYENMNPPVANNVLDDIEPSSPEKEFSIDIPDSSDGESIQSIATPQRKNIFSNKESTKQNYFKNMTIVQQKRKFSSQQSSDSDDSINIVPKKIFNYTKDKSLGMLPKELLKNLKKDRANTSSSIEVPLKCIKAHNLFGKEPKTKPKISDMGLKNVPSASDVDMHEISSKQIFTLNRRSSVKLHVRSSIQSVIDEDWSQPLPSSTMIGSMSDEETPNHKRISGKSVHLSQSQNKPIDQENSMDNTLVSDNNDNIENPNLSEAQSQLEDISADHNETLVNQSISKNNKSQLKDTSGDHNQTHINESIYKETEKSLNNSNNNQMQNNKNSSSTIPANIVHEGLGKENSNMTLKDNTRVSEGSSNSSVNNSGWDSHRTTRKTMRQTFGKDFTPRKSLRTLVMEKTAKRHTVGNFRSQDISKKTKMSNIYQTNNTHNKTEPGKYFNYNEPPETDDNQSINEESQTNDNQNNFNKINNEIEKQPVVELENQLDYQEQLAEPNDQDETINQLANQEKEIYQESSNYDEDNQIADQEEMVVSNNDDEAENRSEENDEVEQFTNDEQNQSIDQEQLAESYNNYEAENSTEAMNQEENVDCENENSQSNDEEQMSEINNEVENQTEEDEQREMVVTDDEAEDAVQEELRESTIDMPNESYDEEQVAETEANHEYEDENTSGVEQEEMIESINDANKSACEEQMAESSHDEDANQSENDQEEDEVENHSEDEEQEEIILSDSEQQIEENDDSENQCNNEASNNDEMPETNDENQDSYAEETNNHLNDNEDISQMPQANSTEYPIFESTQAKETAKKGVNRQKMRELIEKIRVENAEKKKRFEVEVNDWRKNLKPQNTNTFFKVPQKPAIKRPKPKETKKAKPADKMFFNVLPPEFFEDIKYKPPKRFQPRNAAWANKHLYTFLEQKLEKKYDYRARVRAEKLVEKIYKFTQDIRRLEVAPEPAVTNLKQEMARLKIVDTHFDFYEFIIDFLPQDIRHKVVPSGVNLIPLPRPSVYSSIMTENNC
ncbi:GATA zinc finger domain-containing protein 14-like [Pieris napi]|uniref:GATA zinc finger domain-containing protein 14-like n=1 Tax=Pieris napi TaxID=78633 RepID=UPI001FBA54D7|nr:GATA zinc finger domain-containing protein 14-like [Pieris napi]XP_047503905.1 GATA zinc finger domain-containing protein 14-like [Pieris napi]